MDVSVVIPTRDRPELLALTLCSVLRQEGVDAEVLVVDDGSEPDTEALIKQIGDARVRLLGNTGPRGVSGARNSGIAVARGNWIAFLDDDDLWAPGKLAMQLAVAEEARAGWVYAGDVTVDEALRVRAGAPPPTPEEVVTQLRRHNAVPAGASNVAVRRDVLDAVGRFDPELCTSEDWDLWLRLAATGLPACVPRPLVALRTHAGMASRAVDRMLADTEVIARRHGIHIDRARHERWAAWMCLEDGRHGPALRHYARAVMAGDPASLGRAAVALVYPQIARHRPFPTNGWAREAQAWLNALRPQSVGAGRAVGTQSQRGVTR
jgi:glycosyltransferase involved in cell wall biosynthesis